MERAFLNIKIKAEVIKEMIINLATFKLKNDRQILKCQSRIERIFNWGKCF